MDELNIGIDKMKNDKATEIDDICIEHIKIICQ